MTKSATSQQTRMATVWPRKVVLYLHVRHLGSTVCFADSLRVHMI